MDIKNFLKKNKAPLYLTYVPYLACKYKGSLKRKAVFARFACLTLKNGVVPFRVQRVADLYTKDWLDFKGTSSEQKKWAYNHGFSSYKMAPWYGITKDNYRDYVSDFDFYAERNYIDQRDIMAWFEHKLNTYFLLSPYKKFLPVHYYYKYKRTFYPMDVPGHEPGSEDSILKLLENHKLAAKACYGGHGVGFYKLEKGEHCYLVNGIKSDEEAVRKLLSGLNNYIITDYETPHPFFRELCGEDSFSVLRVITVCDPQDGPQLTCTVIRLGCIKAGITSDHEGTIYCGITLDEGISFKPLYRVADNLYEPCAVHPDTGKPLEGFSLPNFDLLKTTVLSISRYLPMTPYLVMDIIPTESGFSILEINSHGQVGNVEPFYPFCKNPYNRGAFKIEY